MTTMSIGEVARRTGLRASAIRYYEDAGLLPPPRRVNGRRRYDTAVLTRLAVVRLAQEVGFTVAEVRTLVTEGKDEGIASDRWREMARRKRDEVQARIDRARQMQQVLEESLRCDCLTLDACPLVLEGCNATLEPPGHVAHDLARGVAG